MAQSTITNYFNNRKRPAVDDMKGRAKVIALDSDAVVTGYGRTKSSEIPTQDGARIKLEASVVFSKDEASKPKPRGLVAATASPKPKPSARTTRRATQPRDSRQGDMKAFLLDKASSGPIKEETKLSGSEESSNVSSAPKPVEQPIIPEIVVEPVEVKAEAEVEASLSAITSIKSEGGAIEATPFISSVIEGITKEKSNDGSSNAPADDMADVSSKRSQDKKMDPLERKESNIEKARKELSLGDIRSKLTRSARLAELKASLVRYGEGREKLKQIEQAKESQQSSTAPVPQLTRFNSIELEVPISPSKSPMKSPLKSPLKIPTGSRSPAFQRYASLALAGTPALPLPFSYRHLAELFRCMESVTSLFLARQETITFEKLQPAVQEMSRKNFSKTHLAQIMTVYPEAYTLKQEKMRGYGEIFGNDKYQLVITPVLDAKLNGDNGMQTLIPSVLLERRRQFYNNVLKIVKKHHQEFLLLLEPPIVVATESLTRWHPEFAVDNVPEVIPAELPHPPHLEKCNSAKDVLAKARQLVSCNPRMEKALESVAKSNSDSQVTSVNIQVVNPPTQKNPPTSPFKNMQLSAALKGLPKALVEKIRAKQAAKAMEAMTRTSAQDKEAAQIARLPDIARILRNIYVTEKKGTLQLDFVLVKLNNSYRTALSHKELEEHIRLLGKAVPGWLSFERNLKTDYLRLSKNGDFKLVLKRLDDLVSRKEAL